MYFSLIKLVILQNSTASSERCKLPISSPIQTLSILQSQLHDQYIDTLWTKIKDPRVILENVGEEITSIITAVTICMLLVVILVTGLNMDSKNPQEAHQLPQ